MPLRCSREGHWRFTCTRLDVEWKGHGSIEAYNNALAAARNAGKAVPLTDLDTKEVTRWGGMRNDAAHRPTTFDIEPKRVANMIDDIRSFLKRVQ